MKHHVAIFSLNTTAMSMLFALCQHVQITVTSSASLSIFIALSMMLGVLNFLCFPSISVDQKSKESARTPSDATMPITMWSLPDIDMTFKVLSIVIFWQTVSSGLSRIVFDPMLSPSSTAIDGADGVSNIVAVLVAYWCTTRKVVVMGGGVMLCSVLSMMAQPQTWLFPLFYMVYSFGNRCIFIGSMICIVEMAPPIFQGTISAFICCGISMTNVLSVVIAEPLYRNESAPFRMELVVLMTAILVAFTVWFSVLKRVKETKGCTTIILQKVPCYEAVLTSPTSPTKSAV